MDISFWEAMKLATKHFIFEFGPKLIYAGIALIIGMLLIKVIRGFIMRMVKRSHADLSIQGFIRSFSTALLWAILLFVVGIILGVQASAFFTMFGAAGIAIGLALQGSLSNFAGGILILLFKPFKVGDEVIIDGVQGYVEDISILYTRVNNWRGEVITMPNGKVSNNMVRNNSADDFRRIEIELHFEHDVNFDELRELVISTMKKTSGASADKPFQFWISDFETYYIKTSARCWCPSVNYWDVYFAQREAIKKALEEKGIKLAIPKQAILQPDLQSDSKQNTP